MDPRFLCLTAEDIEAEYWAYYYEKNKGEEHEDDDVDVDAIRANEEALAAEFAERARAQVAQRKGSTVQGPPPGPEQSPIDDWEEVELP
ncbi:hypothetical protein [Burkholderia anthina]|uniref:hypothetical protein n=1 Tax=Burkholderia anthina TaxID=179879 RepID=UPI00158A1DA9|nr:hypothetical protein [Burkholderia anthina]